MKASEFFTDRRSSYRGDVIAALTAIVEKAEIRNAQLCANCHKSRGQHSHTDLECPNVSGPWFGPAKFKAIRCYALIGGGPNPQLCEKAVVVGQEVCAAHLEEANG